MVWLKNKIILSGIIFLAIFLIVISIICVINKNEKANSFKQIKINDKIITVEVASSLYSQYLGLSNRTSLCSDCGMLFIFPEKQKGDFVMRDMNFSLDLIFINDNKIVAIYDKLVPEGSKPINSYRSIEPIDMALELAGGYSQQNNIQVGDQIEFSDSN